MFSTGLLIIYQDFVWSCPFLLRFMYRILLIFFIVWLILRLSQVRLIYQNIYNLFIFLFILTDELMWNEIGELGKLSYW